MNKCTFTGIVFDNVPLLNINTNERMFVVEKEGDDDTYLTTFESIYRETGNGTIFSIKTTATTNMKMEHMKFSDNEAEKGYGGAIYFDFASTSPVGIEWNDVTFGRNYALFEETKVSNNVFGTATTDNIYDPKYWTGMVSSVPDVETLFVFLKDGTTPETKDVREVVGDKIYASNTAVTGQTTKSSIYEAFGLALSSINRFSKTIFINSAGANIYAA